MADENIKEYGDEHQHMHVIEGSGDAITAIVQVMEAVDMDSQELSLCVLRYIDKTIKDGKKGYATLLVIDELSGVLPKNAELILKVDGKETTIKDYLRSMKDKPSGNLIDKLKDVLE